MPSARPLQPSSPCHLAGVVDTPVLSLVLRVRTSASKTTEIVALQVELAFALVMAMALAFATQAQNLHCSKTVNTRTLNPNTPP